MADKSSATRNRTPPLASPKSSGRRYGYRRSKKKHKKRAPAWACAGGASAKQRQTLRCRGSSVWANRGVAGSGIDEVHGHGPCPLGLTSSCAPGADDPTPAPLRTVGVGILEAFSGALFIVGNRSGGTMTPGIGPFSEQMPLKRAKRGRRVTRAAHRRGLANHTRHCPPSGTSGSRAS